MPPRPTSRILDILAEETDDLTQIALKLDALLPGLIEQLPDHASPALRDLQRIDALWQHLRDISRTLKTVSTLVEKDAQLDVSLLIDQVRLDYFKHRLLDDPVRPDPGLGDGQPILF